MDRTKRKENNMKRSQYDKQLIRWVKDHYWDSLEKDKDLILRHMRTFTASDYEPSDVEILNAYYDYREEMRESGPGIHGKQIRQDIWSEAFKRGMRFSK